MNKESSTRTYRQTARAKAAEETGQRILASFFERLQSVWFEEIRLDDIAKDSGVTVQTVIRRFGGREGLLDASQKLVRNEILEARALAVGDVNSAIEAIIREYDKIGPFSMRLLAQEERYAQIFRITEEGRMVHRDWVGRVFAPWLDKLKGTERSHAHDRLVIALDLYIWKLVRIDMKRSKAELRRTMLELAAAALATTPKDLLKQPKSEKADG